VQPISGCTGKSLVLRILRALSTHFPQLDIYYVPQPKIREDLLKIENNSPEVKKKKSNKENT
jgi:hypothetical protein